MTAAVFSVRPLACLVCRAPLTILSATTPHPEAPEMLCQPHGAWIGFVRGDVGIDVIVTCSERCTKALLFE